jgi:hypothetical protein
MFYLLICFFGQSNVVKAIVLVTTYARVFTLLAFEKARLSSLERKHLLACIFMRYHYFWAQFIGGL